MKKVLLVFGTRPEAIKMAPLALEMQNHSKIDCKVCVTGQHEEMLAQVLNIFELVPDFNLKIMEENQDVFTITQKILIGLKEVFKTYQPDLILVHGDTASTLGAALAAFFSKIPIAHIEAGLRTGNLLSPWPEEGNRKLVGSIADWHFAATEDAKNNLLKENVAESQIFVTGNTVIDALILASKKVDEDELNTTLQQKFAFCLAKPMLLVTAHRRENIGKGIQNIAEALKQLALENPALNIVFPVHKNPNIRQTVFEILEDIENVYLIEPLEYLDFVFLMKNAYLILTDSGGIQEEAPSLGKPVLVMRDTTERGEAVLAGTVKLIGSSKESIVSMTTQLLTNQNLYHQMTTAHNPYGDGHAAKYIVDKIIHMKNKW